MGLARYRPEIDGLRAFAVLPVILFHMGFRWISGGYIGVDVFFVISGFLITSIVKRELESGNFSFANFWARRIRRIMPAMLAVVGLTLAAVSLYVFKPDQPYIAGQALAALFSVANIYYWRSTGNYWGTAAEESPFLHTWSLSVEEQFYLLFPIVCWICFRYRPQWLKGLMLFGIVSSFALFLYGSQAHPEATFYLLPTRAWELAAGCWLALAIRSNHAEAASSDRWVLLGNGYPATLGLGMILASYAFLPTLSGWLAIAVFGTVLIIAYGQEGICYRILTLRPVVHIGKLSYSLYLWHWPVLVLADYFHWYARQPILLVPIYLLSMATYLLVEQPLRRQPKVVPKIGLAYGLLLGLTTMLFFSKGLYDTSAFARPQSNIFRFDIRPNSGDALLKRVMGNTEAQPSIAPPEAYLKGGIILGPGDERPKILVLGDSHGVMWSGAIAHVTEKMEIKTSFYSVNGMTPFIEMPLSRVRANGSLMSDERYDYAKARLDWIKQCQPEIVILCSRWSHNSEKQVSGLMGYLEQHAGQILLMEQPPIVSRIGNRNALQYLYYMGIEPNEGKQYLPIGDRNLYEGGRRLIRKLAQKYKHTSIIPTCDLYAHGDEVMVLDGNEVVYFDDDHLTAYGALLAAPRIEESISKVFKTNAK